MDMISILHKVAKINYSTFSMTIKIGIQITTMLVVIKMISNFERTHI